MLKRTRPTFRSRTRPAMWLSLSVMAIGLIGLLKTNALADPEPPTPNERRIALIVSKMLPAEHLSKHRLDDTMSERLLNNFLDTLDPMKAYFYQSDVDRFRREQHNLDDLVRKGDIRFAHEVYSLYLKRLDERLNLVKELIEVDHDFTQDEYLSTDFDNQTYPRDASEARERWRKRVKYDLLRQKIAKKEPAAAREKIAKRYRSFGIYKHQTDTDELLETYLTALTTCYDPHTSYMSPGTQENFRIMMRLQLDGIGASLQSIDGETVVHRIIPGGAASNDGRLTPKDRIIGVGQGTDGELKDVVNMRLNDVVNLIRGKRGTIVRLQVTDESGKKQETYDITRAAVKLKDSEARGEIIEETRADGKAYRVGVINLPSFYMDMDGARQGKVDFKSTTRDVRRLLEDFKAKGVDAVVVDLRSNGGGSLTESINLTGLFIDQGTVVQVKDSKSRVDQYKDRVAGVTWDGPLVVLTSKFSASASEIFAGALQDYNRALIVGDYTTHGKGTVQSLLDLSRQVFPQRFRGVPELGALKVTMQQFYRPNGDSTQNRGVVSDVELPSLTTHLDVGEADLDFAVAFDQVKPADVVSANQVNKQMVAELNRLSGLRRQTSEDFDKVAQRITRYKKQKAAKRITLNEKQYLADHEDLEKEKKELEDEQNDPENPVVKRDYYFNEALAVTLDYVKLLRGEKVVQTKR